MKVIQKCSLLSGSLIQRPNIFGNQNVSPANMPKIAATESFVDPVTLLPRRGPQAAAMLAPPKPARPAK
jgi:hypothetical protein